MGRNANCVSPVVNGSRSAVLPDLLPKTLADRMLPSSAFAKDHPSACMETQFVEEVGFFF